MVLTQLINIIDVHESFGDLVDRTEDISSRTESRRRKICVHWLRKRTHSGQERTGSKKMSFLRMRRIRMFPHDSHPSGYQDSGRCKKSTQTWKKQPVTSYFSLSGTSIAVWHLGGPATKRSGAGFLFPVLSGVHGDFQHGECFKRRAGLPLWDLR